jgi:lipoate-protein ligase A
VTSRRSTGWAAERSTASAASLLAPWPTEDIQNRRHVRRGRVRGSSTLVLGSTQDRSVVDEDRAAAAGIDVLHRSTGGGAVLVAPEAQVWLDFWIPRRDDLWDDDIIRSSVWLGETWRRALESLGVTDLHVHGGPASRHGFSDLICFAGLGPGEVVVDGGGQRSKVVGIAQRRTRSGARFHASAPLSWDPGSWSSLLGMAPLDAEPLLGDAAIGLHSVVPNPDDGFDDADLIGMVEDAVIDALP